MPVICSVSPASMRGPMGYCVPGPMREVKLRSVRSTASEGVGVRVGRGVLVSVAVAVLVGVGVLVAVSVAVFEGVAVGVLEGVAVGVADGASNIKFRLSSTTCGGAESRIASAMVSCHISMLLSFTSVAITSIVK